LQHPPTLIKELLEGYNDGYDQVIAKRTRTGDSPVRSFVSRLYYKVMNKFVDIELVDGIGDFRLLSRRAVDSLLSLSEYNRFSKGLFSWIGYNELIIEYENVLRSDGESKWTFSKLLNYGIDGVISFNNKPLRLSIYLGLLTTILGLLYVITTFVQIILGGVEVPGYFTLISAILFIGGIQLIFLGVIGEYIGRIYYETKRRPHFIVAEKKVSEVKQKA
ncbi:glycosyltransferase family 2 protein, partial [Bacillus sp. HC-Mk]